MGPTCKCHKKERTEKKAEEVARALGGDGRRRTVERWRATTGKMGCRLRVEEMGGGGSDYGG